ncbi:unnamed protein product [Blepharisma stoltei]|uniref:protein-tyrosine-phosphatase n=1 Tax=Blepharisma stoltei TaxID=1481888 RepID=A0AAU9JIR2_9CILI|nr:unnamed protein product [Blepharisma stoltei]
MSGARHSFQEVIPGLFIGSQFSLSLIKHIKAAGITQLLSVNNFKDMPSGFTTKTLNVEDETDEDISIFFEECIEFIKSGSTLVFCTAGRSRSATIVAAYLIKEKKMRLKDALSTINQVRKVNPNPGFLKQLKNWDNKLHCELCRLEKISEWFFDCDDFAVMICDQCELPMAVYKKHTNFAKESHRKEIKSKLSQVANQYFKNQHWKIDYNQRTIKDHLHWHARPMLIVPKL